MTKSHFNCKLTISEEEQVVKIYQAGFHMRQIAKAYDMGHRAIHGALLRQGIVIRHGGPNASGCYFDGEEDKKIAELYQNGMSLLGLADHYNLTNEHAILNSLMRTKTPRRENRTYFFDEHAFDILNNEHALYWLGFIYADGNVTERALRFGLSAKDEDHLYRLRNFMDSDTPISTRQNVASIDLNSTYLATCLIELGIVVGRGQFYRLEPHIPDGLASHFIRGYLDGDGCISVNQQVVFLGQLDILSWIRAILGKHAQASQDVKFRKRPGIYEIGWGGRLQAKRIVGYLYQDATIWLNRKRKVASNWN